MESDSNVTPLGAPPTQVWQEPAPRTDLKLVLAAVLGLGLLASVCWAVVERSGRNRAQAGYADLQKEIDAQKAACKDAGAQAQALQEKLNAAESALQSQSAAAKALEARSAGQAEETRKLQEALNAEQERQKNLRDEHQQALANVQAKAEVLNKKAEAEHALVVKKSNEAKDQAGQVDDLNKDLKTAQSDGARLKQTLSDTEAQLKKAQDLDKAQDKLIRAKDTEIAGLQTQLKKGEQEFDRFKRDYDQVKADRDRLDRENKKQDDQIRDLRNELARARKK